MNGKQEETAGEWVAKLVRLKRYESPGQEYFEHFLEEFHERQRSEPLRLSVVTLATDRFLTWWREISPGGRLAGAAAGVGLLAMVAILSLPPAPDGAGVAGTESAPLAGPHPALAEVSLVREF